MLKTDYGLMDVDEVELSQTARSKCFRMISENRLKNIVRNRVPQENPADGEYIFKTDFENPLGQREKVDIVVRKNERKAVVITQKHREHRSNLD